MDIVFFGMSRLLMGFHIFAIVVILVLAAVGLFQVFTTRSDAFTVLDRQQQNWMMLLGGAMIAAVLAYFSGMEMLWAIGGVIVGIYWQDVRPSIKDVLGNAGGTW